MAHGNQGIAQHTLCRCGIMNIVGRHDRQPHAARCPQQFAHQPVVGGQVVVLYLHKQVLGPKQIIEPLQRASAFRLFAAQQCRATAPWRQPLKAMRPWRWAASTSQRKAGATLPVQLSSVSFPAWYALYLASMRAP